MKKSSIIILSIISISFILAFYFYGLMPDQLASHWNAQGEVDGYMSKFLGLFLLPLVSLVLFLLFLFVPRIDPFRENIKTFRKYYDLVWLFLFVFLFYIFTLTVIWNLGYQFNFILSFTPAMAGLWFLLGYILPKLRRNWFIGIRTPWTLSSEEVWNRTHQVGGQLFKLSGLFALIGLAFPGSASFLIILPVLFSALYVTVYSYLTYGRIIQNGKKE
jgi:uncharacterized membrane protein